MVGRGVVGLEDLITLFHILLYDACHHNPRAERMTLREPSALRRRVHCLRYPELIRHLPCLTRELLFFFSRFEPVCLQRTV